MEDCKLYWFVSVPKRGKHGFRDVQARVEKSNWGTCSPFQLPDLRIGTLDTLMSLMDELAKHDAFLASSTAKVARQLVELRLESEDEDGTYQNSNSAAAAEAASKLKLDELLTIGQASIDPFLKYKFRWNSGRWDYEKNSLQSITEDIMKTATSIDALLRQRASEWVTTNRSIQAAKATATGNVLMRDLSTVLKEDQVVDTENLCTMLVVVPKSLLHDWFASYEALEVDDLKEKMAAQSGAFAARVVMPKSSVQVCEDSDNALVSMVVLRPFVDAIKAKLRERKLTPRDFTFDKAVGENKERSVTKLIEQRKVAKIELIKMCKAWFSELFTCWTHLKTVRVWVESVVRFSLPAEFDVILIRPEIKHKDRIRKALDELFKDLVAEGVLELGTGDEMQGIPMFVAEDLFAYVFSEISIVVKQ